jgi:alkylation response protein AidB-like acyl-CoA dehydrogenase
MDFELTAEQCLVQDMVREFAAKEVLPYVEEYDREERFPVEIVKKMAEIGWMGGSIPTAYGGAGLDHQTLVVAVEEMSKVCHILGLCMSLASGLVGSSVLQFGTDEQKHKYLAPLARGEVLAGAGVTEPHSGTDVAAMQTKVRRIKDGYVINGSKAWISFLDVAEWFVTFGTLDKNLGPKGICAFIVEKNSPGLSWRPFKNKLGFRPIATGELVFEDCFVPKKNLLGAEGEGLKVALCAVENGRMTVAARAVGLAQSCLDASVAYAQERIVMGQSIGKFQLVQSMITDMIVGIESARYLTYKVAWLKDRGHARARKASSLAKMHASDVAMMAATNAVQIHGAYGVAEEYHVARHFRDAKVFQIVEGQNQLHKALIAELELGYRSA